MADLKTSGAEVRKFREQKGLDQASLDRLFGFASGGRATRRWEAGDAPYYVSILIAYGEGYGLEKMTELASRRPNGSAGVKVPASDVIEFRKRHRLDQADLDRLLGFTSGGRATRLWESGEAPHYFQIIMTYADAFGVGKMEELAARSRLQTA